MDSTKNMIQLKFLAPQFSIPLFILSRNRIKESKLNELREYLTKKSDLYDRRTDADCETSTLKYREHTAGSGKRRLSMPSQQKPTTRTASTPNMFKESWKLPPNLYDTNKIPYENKRGLGGAYWRKSQSHKLKPRPRALQSHATSSYFPPVTGKWLPPCSRSKGVFLTNARERRATARCMISNMGTCYKNPSEPGPATYNPTQIKKVLPTSKKVKVFPVKVNSIHTGHASFTAAPGRYETRYLNTCPCPSKLIYSPQIQLDIDKEKRKKFRRLPYEKIDARHYFSPDWNHVKGRGFHYLFMGGVPQQQYKNKTQQERKNETNIPLYPDSKYLAMINNPRRMPLSFRPTAVARSIPSIKFNCVVKKTMRKHLTNNKKIVFNSSQERFPNGYRLPILTQKQQEELKKALPPERQCRDHPITNKRLSEIQSKLNRTPQHRVSKYLPELSKRMFKFQPLPQAKVLITRNETEFINATKEGFYLSSLEADKFFKESVTF